MEIDAEAEMVLRKQAKAVLRQRARALRNTIPEGAIKERSARIVASLLGLPEIAGARSVALFYPIEGRNEVDLRALDAELRAKGARIAYPAIEQETRVMSFRFVAETEAMEERGLGFREPAEDAEEAVALDAIVVPALQIDASGHRIGYGAGYYDRTLPRYSPPATAIGVAFDFQLIAEVPVTEGDVAVSMVVTDQRVFRVGDAAEENERPQGRRARR
ncbi:MAG TPA: 5-formyltetrahydrofolate cyclo-ligase [Polyangiaceae bacterium]|jgi:5-formyltetrahydrofolate cyclo-ligase|nr:5-formyltetrahydrofolate cyclo-ligase [Polyangiaceae bacterium]